jgi:4-amino-4-deoxy-L-arabinose transferase-like glycosyltransferase
LAFYLFMPYGIIASRSFQPDSLMVMLILAFWWLVWRWAEQPGWKRAILAGLIGGLAIFVKLVAAFFVIGGALGLLLGRFRLRDILKNSQLWVMAALGFLPGAIWVLFGLFIARFLRNEFGGNFIPSLFINPSFYLGWQANIVTVVGSIGITLGLLGWFFARKGGPGSFLLSVWSSYLVFGFFFNYHISTHDYYSLPLIPVVALSLAPLGDKVAQLFLDTNPKPWVRVAFYFILLYGAGASLWKVRNEMKSVDYRPVQTYWAEISHTLGQGASVIALTDDYGSGLAYWGWQTAAVWPSSGQLIYRDARGGKYDLESLFAERARGKSFFLVSDLDDLERQPDLKQLLYTSYPILSEGEGYVIFDLARPNGSLP